MSVLIPSFKVYQGIASKIHAATFNNVCDINHFSSCFSFSKPLTEAKIWEIVSTLLDLNEISYVAKYAANDSEVKYQTLNNFLTKRFIETPNTYQFLKWLQCVRYNIEVTTIQELRDLNEWETYCMNFLHRLIEEAKDAIIGSLDEYENATYSN